MSKNRDLAAKIIEFIGGKENIISASACMTRIRIDVKDPDQVEREKLKDLVLGLTGTDVLQVIVGPGRARKITDIFAAEFGIKSGSELARDWQDTKADIKATQQRGSIRRGLETIAGIFIPLLPAIIAAGIFNGFASLIGTLQGAGTLAASSTWNFIQLTFSLIGTAFLSYFAIFTGVNAAKRFGATEALGGMIGAITIGAQINDISRILGLFNAEVPLNSILTTGKGGIIGVILGVYLLSKVEGRIRRIVPDVLDVIVTPLVSLLIMSLIMVVVIMPVTGFASDILVSGLRVIILSDNTIVNIISGYVLAALFLPMVLLGLHHGLIPLYAVQLETLGNVPLYPVLAMAGAGQVGAAVAIYFMAKKMGNDRLRTAIVGGLPAGILGIGEPLIYGVTLPLGKPFITAGLGAGFGGAFARVMGVASTAWGPSGLVALPLMLPETMVNYLIGIIISYIGGFVVTRLLIKESDLEKA